MILTWKRIPPPHSFRDDKIVNSHVSFQRKTSQESKQNKKKIAGGNAVPWRDEWILSKPLISWGSHWNFCISTSPCNQFLFDLRDNHKPQRKLRRRRAEFGVGKPMNYLFHTFSSLLYRRLENRRSCSSSSSSLNAIFQFALFIH